MKIDVTERCVVLSSIDSRSVSDANLTVLALLVTVEI
jgi:hypothetical protein